MKYIENKDLIKGKFYHCITYNDDDIIVQYFGEGKFGAVFGAGLSDGEIRYVISEARNLKLDRDA